MSKLLIFAAGMVTGAALLLGLTWGYIWFDDWMASHQGVRPWAR